MGAAGAAFCGRTGDVAAVQVSFLGLLRGGGGGGAAFAAAGGRFREEATDATAAGGGGAGGGGTGDGDADVRDDEASAARPIRASAPKSALDDEPARSAVPCGRISMQIYPM